MADDPSAFGDRLAALLANDPHLRSLERRLDSAEERSRQAIATSDRAYERELAIMRERPNHPPISSSGWSLEAWIAHSESVRRMDERWQDERDRRYTEVNIEREKALKIKETADRDALGLAREIQTYKDEKANELRSQIERERGTYATQGDLKAAVEKLEAQVKPALDFILAASGRTAGIGLSANVLVTFVFVIGAIVGIVAYFVTH